VSKHFGRLRRSFGRD
jgi:hypothetical protein